MRLAVIAAARAGFGGGRGGKRPVVLLGGQPPTFPRRRFGIGVVEGAVPGTGETGSAHEIGRRISEFAAHGITEIIYQPTGPDITGELEAFHRAARTAVSAVAHDNPGSGLEP
jgi:hypothetical protein